jgi:aspartate racemase
VRKLGIVGGIAPESTIAYYRMINAAYRSRRPDGSYPQLVIDCIDVTRMLGLIGAGQLDELVSYLLASVEHLAHAGAAFGLLASNTPHLVFPELQHRSPIPLLSIVDTALDEAQDRGLRRIGLLGTRFTMQAPFYPDGFAKHGITVIAPSPEEQEYVHHKYVNELVPAMFLPATRAGVLGVVKKMKMREGIDGILLGGTELPLLLPEPAYEGLPFLDTGRIHAEAAAEQMLRS